MPHATAYTLLDMLRRRAGQILAGAGSAPAETPSRVAAEVPGARLRAYQPTDVAGPAVLIVAAPIKLAYIWDLQPEVSVVRQALCRGLRVYLLGWLDPGPAEDDRGLANHAWHTPLAALDAIAGETGEPGAVLAGHSLGGTFAAILAALEPERVRGLVLVDAPLAFGPDRGGPLARAVALAPPAKTLRALAGSPVPGSFTAMLSTAAGPDAFIFQRWADLGTALGDEYAAGLHARVQRWVLDEFAMPGRLFEEVLELLYREDQLARGGLEIAGRLVSLGQVRCPALAVLNPPGRVVPPASILEGLGALPRHVRCRVLHHGEAERGVALQHLGPLIGRAAHARLWPEILDWIGTTDAPVRRSSPAATGRTRDGG